MVVDERQVGDVVVLDLNGQCRFGMRALAAYLGAELDALRPANRCFAVTEPCRIPYYYTRDKHFGRSALT